VALGAARELYDAHWSNNISCLRQEELMHSACSKSAGTKPSNRSKELRGEGLGYSLGGQFGKQPLTRGPHNSSATSTEYTPFPLDAKTV
jgi:hypothetical protein